MSIITNISSEYIADYQRHKEFQENNISVKLNFSTNINLNICQKNLISSSVKNTIFTFISNPDKSPCVIASTVVRTISAFSKKIKNKNICN